MEKLQAFIKDVIKSMLEAFVALQMKITNMSKKNSAEVEAQYHRLKDFEERNIDDPTNSQNIPHLDVLYLKKEIARYNISIAMILSIKESIIE